MDPDPARGGDIKNTPPPGGGGNRVKFGTYSVEGRDINFLALDKLTYQIFIP